MSLVNNVLFLGLMCKLGPTDEVKTKGSFKFSLINEAILIH